MVARVEFLVNDQLMATLHRPPWQAQIELPTALGGAGLDYLTVAVYLDDGTRAEDLRFLNQPEYLEEVSPGLGVGVGLAMRRVDV